MPWHSRGINQRTLGGAVGLLLLVFALFYHFSSTLLDHQPDERAQPQSQGLSQSSTLMQFDVHTKNDIEANAPPIPDTVDPSAKSTVEGHTGSVEPMVLSFDNHKEAPPRDETLLFYKQAILADENKQASKNRLAQVEQILVDKMKAQFNTGALAQAHHTLSLMENLSSSGAAQFDIDLAFYRRVLSRLQQARRLLRQGQEKNADEAMQKALELYRQVLQMDTENQVASQGIQTIQGYFLGRATQSAKKKNFSEAEHYLQRAGNIRPDSVDLHDATVRIAAMRQHYKIRTLFDEANTALDAGNARKAHVLAEKISQHSSVDKSLLTALRQQIKQAYLYGGHQPGQTIHSRLNRQLGQGPDMVVIPVGSFHMGSSRKEVGHKQSESPLHLVHFDVGFAMAKHEVTVGQFRTFIQASDYIPDSVRLDGSQIYNSRTGVMRKTKGVTWEDDYRGKPADDALPVVNVSWNDASAYAHWLARMTGKDYQLPSEAQFAYALRAKTTTRYWWGNKTPSALVENLTGDGDRSLTGRRWRHAFVHYSDGYWGPAPVARFAPNPFGLYDMAGNVSEWVRDCWHDNYVQAPDDGMPWVNAGCYKRVIRGGSWGSSPGQDRSAWRDGAPADARGGRVGFRVVLDFAKPDNQELDKKLK